MKSLFLNPLNKINHYMGFKFLFLSTSFLTILSLLKETFIPNINLAIILGFAVVLDFITGIIKSMSKDVQSINSGTAKNKGITASWYFIIVVGSGFCRYVAKVKGGFTYDCAKILTDWALWYLIWSEILSISENGIETKGLPKNIYNVFKAIHEIVSLQFLRGWFVKNLSERYDNQNKIENK